MNKICFIISTTDMGGIERYLLRFIEKYCTQLEITVICLNGQRGTLASKYEALPIQMLYQGIGYLNICKAWRVLQFFRSNQFDAVCDFNGNFAGIAMSLAYLANIKKRITFYRRSSDAFPPSLFKNLYNQWVNRLVSKFSTHIFSNSQHAFDYFFRSNVLIQSKFEVIPNGVPRLESKLSTFEKNELLQLFGLSESNKIVGHVGRYDSSKNHETILKVARELCSTFKHMKFVLCGRGTDGETMAEKISELGLENNVVGLGQREDVQKIIQLFDVFYFPSVTEGQPNALIEAMMCNIPIVASSIPPIKEVIPVSMHHHVLVDPLNVNEAVELLSNILAENNQVEQFDWNKWAEEKFDMDKNFELFFNKLSK